VERKTWGAVESEQVCPVLELDRVVALASGVREVDHSRFVVLGEYLLEAVHLEWRPC
jgi:hypothetical protein